MPTTLTLTNLQPLLKKFAVVLGVFLVLAGMLYLILTRLSPKRITTPPPQPSETGFIRSADFSNPPLVEKEGDILFGSVYKLGGNLYAWGAVKELKEKTLFLFPNLSDTAIFLEEETKIIKPQAQDSYAKLEEGGITDLQTNRWVRVQYETQGSKVVALEIILVN